MTQIIAVAASKGGVGKTTVAVHLAASLARLGARSLIVDLDSQGAVAGALQLNDFAPGRSITNQLAAADRLAALVVPEIPGVSVVPAHPDLDDLQATFPKGRLRALIDTLMPAADFALLDLAPSLDPLTLWALGEADSVIVVMQASPLSLRTVPALLKRLLTRCEHTRIEGILVNHAGADGEFGQSVLRAVERNFGDWVLPVQLRFDDSLQRASIHGRSIFAENPECSAARAFEALGREMLARYPLVPVHHAVAR